MTSNFDPFKHKRRSIRLKGWDYTNPAAYFVTVCTYKMQILFDNPQYRQIAENAWVYIPKQLHAKHASLDEWIVMPNHLHGIILLTKKQGESAAKPPERGAAPGSLSSVVGTYKSMVTHRINNLRRTPGGKVWQRGYFERIVRNERELNAIRQYICTNPTRWAEDRENIDVLTAKMNKIDS